MQECLRGIESRDRPGEGPHRLQGQQRHPETDDGIRTVRRRTIQAPRKPRRPLPMGLQKTHRLPNGLLRELGAHGRPTERASYTPTETGHGFIPTRKPGLLRPGKELHGKILYQVLLPDTNQTNTPGSGRNLHIRTAARKKSSWGRMSPSGSPLTSGLTWFDLKETRNLTEPTTRLRPESSPTYQRIKKTEPSP